MLVKELEEEKKNEQRHKEQMNDLEYKIRMLNQKIYEKKQSNASNSVIEKLEHDLTRLEMDLRILQTKEFGIKMAIYKLNQKIESITYYLHQRRAFVESINNFKPHNVKKAYRNVSLPNKTMNINAESIKSVSPVNK